jgi:diguanylate cyclase (GGDEF)-like protein/PAS domain S-box-containing protein
MIDVSGTVFWEYDIATDSLTYDHSGLPALGLDTSQPPTNVRNWLALVHPDDKHRFLGLTMGTVSTALPALDHDYRVKGAGGEWVWVHTRGAVIRTDSTGQPQVLGGGIVNIQARKQAEVALQASEQTSQLLAQMLRSLCDNVPDMIWAKDLNHRYVFANKAMCEQLLMAQDPNEPVGKDDLYFAQRQRAQHPDNPHWHTFGELCHDSDTATLNQGSAAQFEESGNVQGQWLVLDVRKAPFVNEAGQTVGVVGTGRNVTEQKAANDKLRLAHLVLEHSSEALIITDEHNLVIEVNPAFTSLTGYSRAEILGQKPSVLRSGQQDADFYRRMWEALKTDGNWQGEIWNRRKDGAVFVEWLSINTLYDPDGQPHRRVALFSDVTEKKKKEEMLWQQANFDLLTLLPNRRMFQDRLGVELKKLHRSGNKLAVFFMDLDHFKEVNDTLGHNLGDQLLMQVAKRILGCVRDSDTVARLGGDEFTVILTDIDNPGSAERVAQAVVSALVQPFDLDGHAVQVSVSVGIAISPDHSSEPAALLQLADQAMYLAKRGGRNGYRFSQQQA